MWTKSICLTNNFYLRKIYMNNKSIQSVQTKSFCMDVNIWIWQINLYCESELWWRFKEKRCSRELMRKASSQGLFIHMSRDFSSINIRIGFSFIYFLSSNWIIELIRIWLKNGTTAQMKCSSSQTQFRIGKS